MATILLVDDVELFLELEGSYLEETGHHLVKATCGKEALRLVRETDPALLLLDLYLPDIDGDEVCRRLRTTEGRSDLPVLMVTAGGKEEEIRRCMAAGCDDYLTKPVNKRELLEKVGRFLGNEKRTESGTPADGGLVAENQRLLERIAELEEENRDFAQQLIRTEEVNNSLTNLYIASSRLHSVLHHPQVVEIIKEVVINFVGAEKFALLLFDKETQRLAYETGEGFARERFPDVAEGCGLLWEVMSSGESFFEEGSVVAGSDDPLRPLAAIPLKIHGRTLGVLAVYRLFIQKERFEPLDYQLFSMLAEHAATAIFSASLYERSERKRETYRGFMDLLLK